MLSMPRGTDPLSVQRAAREFAQAELADHSYVMVLHDHQANPHVHISVRAESKHGKRLNPRKADLHRWRETFAEKLRGWGIEAEATRQATRGADAQLRSAVACEGARRRPASHGAASVQDGSQRDHEPRGSHRGMGPCCPDSGRIGRQRRPRAGAGDHPVRA